jgi:transposase
MTARPLAVSFALTSALALAACGDDNKSSGPSQSTAAQAITEIGETRKALEQGLEQLRSGDRAAAEETVAEGYLQHFEEVEGPLGKVDKELNEKLEDALKADLRAKIKDGAPVAEISALIDEVKADLATAETQLR